MELVVLVTLVAAAYGVRSGYVGAKNAARNAITQWAAGTRPESTWGRRAGIATGGLAWAAFQGARGFKNSFGPGFWEGAQRVAEWAEQKKWVQSVAGKERVARHVAGRQERWLRKASMVKPKRVTRDQVPPARPEPPDGFFKSGVVHDTGDYYGPPLPPQQTECDQARDNHWWPPGAPEPDDPCLCGAKAFKNAFDASDIAVRVKAVKLKPSTTTTAPTKENTMASETTVTSLTQFLANMKAEVVAVVDDAEGAATRAGNYYTAVTNEIDGATGSGFKNDIVGPLTAAADALHLMKEAQAKAALAASDAYDAVNQAEAEISKHTSVIDAASGLTGGTNAMAEKSAYQDA